MAASNDDAGADVATGSWIPAIFFGLVILAAILFTLYVLLWNGGAHT